ncbi:hypothetical protein K2X33_07275 [bacterium]|nr:hypothetical protein [bacterium]
MSSLNKLGAAFVVSILTANISAKVSLEAQEEGSEQVREQTIKKLAPQTQQTGQQLGQAVKSQNGGLGTEARDAANQASAQAMDQSAYVDTLYAQGLLTKEDWLKVKASMTGTMMDAVKKAGKGDTALTPPAAAVADSPSASSSGSFSAPELAQQSRLGLGSTGGSRIPNSVEQGDPTVAGADEQILDLSATKGNVVFGAAIIPDNSDKAPIDKGLQNKSEADKLGFDDSRQSRGVTSANLLVGGSQNRSGEAVDPDKITPAEKAQLLAQKLMQDHKAKLAAKAAQAKEAPAEEPKGDFREAQAKALLSLQGLKKVKRVQEGDEERPLLTFTPEEVAAEVALALSNAKAGENSPLGDITEDSGFPFSAWAMALIGALGLLSATGMAYAIYRRPARPMVHLAVPGSGEHFSIREGSKPGDYILDIMDIRGNLVRSAGMLRPMSVARAAVLPPEIAARIGAKGSFDRFELNHDGEFVPTEKEEGYQVFPFVLENKKSA